MAFFGDFFEMEINWTGECLDTLASLAGKYGRWLNVNHKRAVSLSGAFARSTGLYETLIWVSIRNVSHVFSL